MTSQYMKRAKYNYLQVEFLGG